MQCTAPKINKMSVDMERKQINKFVIENGVLLQYDGQSKVVEIPDGVEWIGRWAFAFNKDIKTNK